ncbi:Proclotting enzyme [Orchesella cincta]|uniref:Phenoloxidase-activating factor 2 n=1 Tax=Orchesella cincta TaxID=48709 RepID=A0A1D2MTK1_ORCCI|nr:Proclotting enzyme [Orchesella cincta]
MLLAKVFAQVFAKSRFTTSLSYKVAIIMDRYEKYKLVRLISFLVLIPCHCLIDVDGGDVNISDSTQGKGIHRGSKQLLLPVVLWPFQLGILPSDNLQFLPLQNGIQIDQRHHFYLTPTKNGFISHEEKSTSHAILQTCRTRHGELGKCQPFLECFPMLVIKHGNESVAQDLMDIPLVEQMMENTRSTVCSQSKITSHPDVVVCCPDVPTSGSGGDKDVRMPAITQRPPNRRKIGLFRQLNTLTCGQSKLQRPYNQISMSSRHQPKITGGVEARGPLEFPWMAAVFGKNKKLLCGASLISENFLLSASHCFSTFKAGDVQYLLVHIGDFNLRTTSDGPHEVRQITKIILHKGFKIENYHNDIALLKLSRPVNFTDRIHPVCLPEPTMDNFEKQKLVVTGWGRKYRYGFTTDTLHKVEMPVWNLEECKRVYSTFAPGRLLDSNICAGDGKRNKDACLGDSGGPAVFYDGEKYVQQGIVSWGKGCGSFPGVYTRVDKFLMWISKNLNLFA